jgi:ferric-dicitrate binding protein FerR (iron transport regulator)
LAAARVAHISQTSIIAEELRDFFAWRRAPRNRAAYRALEADWERTRGRS